MPMPAKRPLADDADHADHPSMSLFKRRLDFDAGADADADADDIDSNIAVACTESGDAFEMPLNPSEEPGADISRLEDGPDEATINPASLLSNIRIAEPLPRAAESGEESEDGEWNEDGSSAGLSSSETSDDEVGTDHGSDTDEEHGDDSWLQFTDDEKEEIRVELREIGMQRFIEKYVVEEGVPLVKLINLIGYRMRLSAVEIPQDQLFRIFVVALRKFLSHRVKLPDVNTFDDTIDLIKRSRKIMVLTGAGVSVSCGIPDFRSKNGIYSRLAEFQLDDPQQMFDLSYFHEFPEIFYSFAREIYPSEFKPSPSHLFIRAIEEHGKLLRNYTQNIDTLEQEAGIERVLQCHGSFASASCIQCGHRVPGSDLKEAIFSQTVAFCSVCTKDDQDENLHAIMKPDIVFFGEKLPDEFDHALIADREEVDLLIVMGSSLKVAPVSEILGQIPHRVPQIVINRTPIVHKNFDVQLLGDSDIIVSEICHRLGWELRHHSFPEGSSAALPEEPCEFRPPNWHLFKGADISGAHKSSADSQGDSQGD